jgi:hypothetical protein
MNDIVNLLRLYAEDLHSLTGFNKYSALMSEAADYIEKLKNQSNICGNDW